MAELQYLTEQGCREVANLPVDALRDLVGHHRLVHLGAELLAPAAIGSLLVKAAGPSPEGAGWIVARIDPREAVEIPQVRFQSGHFLIEGLRPEEAGFSAPRQSCAAR